MIRYNRIEHQHTGHPLCLEGSFFNCFTQVNSTSSGRFLKVPQAEGVALVSQSYPFVSFVLHISAALGCSIIYLILYLSLPLTRNLFISVGIVSDLFLFPRETKGPST